MVNRTDSRNSHQQQQHQQILMEDFPSAQQRHYHSTTSSSSNGGDGGGQGGTSINLERTNSMPEDEHAILVAFEEVLKKMDLPPDKVRTLRNCDLKKKWDLVCDQRKFSIGQTVPNPSIYLDKLKIFMDKKAMKKKKKNLAGESSTTLLKHIEISLRTNTIDWVRSFLSPECDGLRVLVDYISHLQDSLFTVLLNAENENGAASSSSSAALFDYYTSPYPSQQQSMAYIQFASSSSNSNNNTAEQNNNNSITNNSALTSNNKYLGTAQPFFFNVSGSSTSSLQQAAAASASSTMNSSTYSTAMRGGGDDGAMGTLKGFHSKKSSHSNAKHMDHMDDDIHVGISCLRALLNNKFGVVAVFANRQAIYCIVRAILHPSFRTKALVLDMLSAIVTLTDGHELVLGAFNKFRSAYNEIFRFQTLVRCFRCSNVNVDFLASCMKFINVTVHSCSEMNQRVALQYEFTHFGLDRYLEGLAMEYSESEFLLNHINLYWNNCIDVDLLHEKSIKCDEFESDIQALNAENSRQKEEFQLLQADCYVQIAQLNAQLKNLIEEKVELERQKSNRDARISTLTKDWRDRETKFESEKGELERRIALLEQTKREIQQSLKVSQQAAATAAASAAAAAASPKVSVHKTVSAINNNAASSPEVKPQQHPAVVTKTAEQLHQKTTAAPLPPPPPPPPPPPLPPSLLMSSKVTPAPTSNNGPPPPPPLALFNQQQSSKFSPRPPPPGLLTKAKMQNNPLVVENQGPKKRVVTIKNKLPMLNWSVLNPNQVKGTIFNELDDEKLVDVLDLSNLEDFFSIDPPSASNKSSEREDLLSGGGQASPPSSASSVTGGTTGQKTLLGTKRLQNIAIIRRKLGKSVMEIMSGVHRFDLTVLSPDQVEILLPIVPTAEECTKLREYASGNPSTTNNNPLSAFEGLTAEDQFLAQLMGIERLTQKLLIMKFMGDFDDSVRLLIPQIQKVTAAAKSVNNAKKFPKIIEIILAVGNAMNGQKRSPVYGFRLSSLDTLSILKSPKDRNITLLHCIVELISGKFPQLLDFSAELKLAESAATVNMETIGVDVRDIENKFGQAQAEQKRRGKDETPQLLNVFLDSASSNIQSLQSNYKLAQEAFSECAEYFGEVPGRIQPDVFFTRIVSFCKHFEQARSENETKRLAEKRQLESQQKRRSAQMSRRPGGGSRSSGGPTSQDRLLDELNAKFIQSLNGSSGGGSAVNARALKSSKLNDGDFERIMVELSDGFVAPNASSVLLGGASAPPVAPRRRGTKSPSPSRERLNSARELERVVKTSSTATAKN